MIHLGVAGEAAADAHLAQQMVDHRVCAEVDWIAPDLLGAYRCWRGMEQTPGSYLRFASALALARARGLPIRGHFEGVPGAPDAQTVRAILLLFQLVSDRPPDALVIVRDTDGHDERTLGFAQARDEFERLRPDSAFAGRILLAAPHPKRESWLLSAYRAQTQDEQERLSAQTRRLGFDPTLDPGRLRDPDEGGARNAKRVLHALTAGETSREEECIESLAMAGPADQADPRTPGGFLRSVQEQLVPLFRPAIP